jgi:creatinine amidohydrolase/Fe(II)-dependent formamide hydrolase-like protein
LKPPAGVKLFTPDFHAGVSETADMAAFFPEEVDLEAAAALKPEATFHPLGYVGDPASNRQIDARAFFEAEVGFLADCIVQWLREPGQPAPRPVS